MQTSVHVQPQSTNGLGTAGFIISLFGLLTCGILAPIGLMFSLVGLVKAPRGFAIAGSVLGALGSLWFLVAGFALITGCLGLGAATGAAVNVSDHYARHGILPDADEGQRLVDPQGVGKFRYVPLDVSTLPTMSPIPSTCGTSLSRRRGVEQWGAEIRPAFIEWAKLGQ